MSSEHFILSLLDQQKEELAVKDAVIKQLSDNVSRLSEGLEKSSNLAFVSSLERDEAFSAFAVLFDKIGETNCPPLTECLDIDSAYGPQKLLCKQCWLGWAATCFTDPMKNKTMYDFLLPFRRAEK